MKRAYGSKLSARKACDVTYDMLEKLELLRETFANSRCHGRVPTECRSRLMTRVHEKLLSGSSNGRWRSHTSVVAENAAMAGQGQRGRYKVIIDQYRRKICQHLLRGREVHEMGCRVSPLVYRIGWQAIYDDGWHCRENWVRPFHVKVVHWQECVVQGMIAKSRRRLMHLS